MSLPNSQTMTNDEAPHSERRTAPRFARLIALLCSWRRRNSSRSEEHTSELQSHVNLVCRLLLEKKKKKNKCSIPQELLHLPISTRSDRSPRNDPCCHVLLRLA